MDDKITINKAKLQIPVKKILLYRNKGQQLTSKLTNCISTDYKTHNLLFTCRQY